MTDVQLPLQERLGPFEIQGMPLADQIFDLVGGAIADGVIEPGERVNDKELAAALGISRTPVREALQRLTWIGLVEVSPSRYTRVTDVTDEVVESTLEHFGMQASIALRLALPRMDADELTEALVLLDRLVTASERGDSDALAVESQAFLAFLVERSGNPVFMRSTAETSLLVMRNLHHVPQEGAAAEHRTICLREVRTALAERDADAAEHWLRAQHELGVDLAA